MLDDALNYLKQQDYKIEILIIDDGSKDNTIEAVEKYFNSRKAEQFIRETVDVKVIRLDRNSGKGVAVTIVCPYLTILFFSLYREF